ncbi:hypothetical protein GLOTRDRAFT_116767 [Gloeophyllum trabeum ATCC 11539]|uniref:Needs CLA4 to survive protein 3 n=1 Tax=Gloeophyllum trabeum (strain ATCC 11539 / FP-39264 / Madison 617) TaxID=670483 RepID=S7Q3J7_GLOTA|nr:uncharacterized protein GLOTRDRAFT_116767 [Gloeophyllum trabeum ATCC 11539]EPQ54132.1 hypothetical protein GLOTRDRAFT_116767 [Gloeophyllum trabeum ATCC 11539]
MSAAGLNHLDDYQRYGRQMILDGFGLPGQVALQNASVVVVGAGGLGCPALQYLAASGIGRIGIVDHDVVELSNLHRQILHTEQRVGMPKAESAAEAIRTLNSKIKINIYTEALSALNALDILSSYDVILDCTDNAPTRYLLSDTAVALGKPLVSGAAQKFDGQLCVYNLNNEGPCYRCIFPKPPAPEHAGTCEETGILGTVTGVIGTLQALEAIKLLAGMHEGKASLLIYSALGVPPFRSIKLRSRRPTCPACGQEGLKEGQIRDTDYVAFCGGGPPDWEKKGMMQGDPGLRITPTKLNDILASEAASHTKILDVRPRTEFGICHLWESINIPLKELSANPTTTASVLEDGVKEVYVVCRLGNDSQIAADALRALRRDVVVKDVIGGLKAWSRDVDPDFPVY